MITQKTNKRNKLDIQAEGLNLINQYSKELINYYTPLLNTLTGEKIILSNGSNSSKLNKLPKLKHEGIKEDNKFISFQYYLHLNNYGIYLQPKICINGGSYNNNSAYCEYFEYSIFLGEIDNQILKSIRQPDEIITSNKLDQTFTEIELKDLVTQYETLKEQTRSIYNKIPSSVKAATFLN